MAITTGLALSSISWNSACQLGAAASLPQAASSSVLMSAPATNIRPAPLMTIAATSDVPLCGRRRPRARLREHRAERVHRRVIDFEDEDLVVARGNDTWWHGGAPSYRDRDGLSPGRVHRSGMMSRATVSSEDPAYSRRASCSRGMSDPTRMVFQVGRLAPPIEGRRVGRHMQQ